MIRASAAAATAAQQHRQRPSTGCLQAPGTVALAIWVVRGNWTFLASEFVLRQAQKKHVDILLCYDKELRTYPLVGQETSV